MSSLLQVNDEEHAKFNAWYSEHKKTCYGSYDDVQVRFSSTGIGTRIQVVCPHCVETVDITDYTSW